jgi:hypothetical protein
MMVGRKLVHRALLLVDARTLADDVLERITHADVHARVREALKRGQIGRRIAGRSRFRTGAAPARLRSQPVELGDDAGHLGRCIARADPAVGQLRRASQAAGLPPPV